MQKHATSSAEVISFITWSYTMTVIGLSDLTEITFHSRLKTEHKLSINASVAALFLFCQRLDSFPLWIKPLLSIYNFISCSVWMYRKALKYVFGFYFFIANAKTEAKGI